MRTCVITGYRVQYGHNVSHANNKTNRLFLPNLHAKKVFSERLGQIRLTISHRGERTIDKYKGLDEYLLRAKNRYLTPKAKMLKKQLVKLAESDSYIASLINKKTERVKSEAKKRILKKLAKKIMADKFIST
ncbi:MAG: 50S ribosomal protein L28 [Alphaproteobacteria bacterium]|nr:MAG: 50S ribosomal protein L28 [Alphaproteobacteria bacterium]